jgi:hypothetical protein
MWAEKTTLQLFITLKISIMSRFGGEASFFLSTIYYAELLMGLFD